MPETIQEPDEAQWDLQVRGFHVGPQSTNKGELQCWRIGASIQVN